MLLLLLVNILKEKDRDESLAATCIEADENVAGLGEFSKFKLVGAGDGGKLVGAELIRRWNGSLSGNVS